MWKLLLPLALLLGRVGASVLSDRPLPRADFTFINRVDVTTLDFAKMSWNHDFRVARILFEGLTRNDVMTRGFDVVPAIAQRWDISADARTYTFHLRPDASGFGNQKTKRLLPEPQRRAEKKIYLF